MRDEGTIGQQLHILDMTFMRVVTVHFPGSRAMRYQHGVWHVGHKNAGRYST